MKFDRRNLLKSAAGGLALRAIATGLPASILLRSKPGLADLAHLAEGPGRMLILITSNAGDPVNANVPGTYGPGAEEAAHPADPLMAPTQINLSGQRYTTAKPWADLGQNKLDRSVFFHHATYTPVHQDQSRVMKVMGATDDEEMLVSILARELSARQGSVQSVPLSLGARNGSELLSARGTVLANVGPTSIKAALGGATGPLADLQPLRDREVDRLYNLYKEHGTKKDIKLLDAWARSRDEVRGVSDALLTRLDGIDGNDEDNQATAAVVLAAMNITPVITIRGRFGGDNHNDTGLVNETAQHVTGCARIGTMIDEINAMRTAGTLRHEVIVGVQNVFGRTLMKKGTAGRDHNRSHHVTALFGDVFRGSVVGGIERNGNDYRATSIDSATGASGGDIPYEETFGSLAKTLGVALGVPEERMNAAVSLGRPLESVFR